MKIWSYNVNGKEAWNVTIPNLIIGWTIFWLAIGILIGLQI